MTPTNSKLPGLSPELQVYYDKAREAFERKNFGYAVELTHQILASRFDHAHARHLLHLSQMQLSLEKRQNPVATLVSLFEAVFFAGAAFASELRGDISRAVGLYERMLAGTPFRLYPLRRMAVLFEKKGIKDSALYTLEEITTLFPSNVDGQKRLAKIWYDRRDYGRAREGYRKVLQLRPGDPEAEKMIRDIDALGTINRNFEQSPRKDT